MTATLEQRVEKIERRLRDVDAELRALRLALIRRFGIGFARADPLDTRPEVVEKLEVRR